MRIMVGFALLLVGVSAFAEAGSPATELAPGVHLFRGIFTPGSQPDGNSVVFEGRRGFFVVDTGRHAAHTNAIADFVEQRKRPLLAIVNTHWHLDHLGGNLILRDRFPRVQVFASGGFANARNGFLARSKAGLLAEIARLEGNAAAQEPFRREVALIDAGDRLAPDTVVDRTRARRLAGRRVIVGHEKRAVTEGDLWVFDPSTKILVAGDLVTLPAPFLDTACASGWQRSLGELEALGFETLVPGHGPPMTRQQFRNYRSAFDALLACAASSAETSACVDRWMKDAAELIDAQDEPLARAMIDYYVNEHLRNSAKTAELCGVAAR
jgi:glyoxylase-like metal-dependent hydrolase (beta-lactamase superfamily II)